MILTSRIQTIFSAVCLLLLPLFASAQNQQEEEKTPEELAIEEANRLERRLGLEPHQTFYIDSVLQHNTRAMYDEIMAMRAAGTQEVSVFIQIKQIWSARTDSAYKKILTGINGTIICVP